MEAVSSLAPVSWARLAEGVWSRNNENSRLLIGLSEISLVQFRVWRGSRDRTDSGPTWLADFLLWQLMGDSSASLSLLIVCLVITNSHESSLDSLENLRDSSDPAGQMNGVNHRTCIDWKHTAKTSSNSSFGVGWTDNSDSDYGVWLTRGVGIKGGRGWHKGCLKSSVSPGETELATKSGRRTCMRGLSGLTYT